MNALKSAALLCALLLTIRACGQTTVNGSKVQDGTGTGSLLSSGTWCFNATCTAVTNGAFSESVTAGTQTVTVKNASSVTILTIPGVVVSASMNWDFYVVPGSASISGTGVPLIACAVGAAYTQTDASPPNNAFTCANLAGQAVWTLSSTSGTQPTGNYTGYGPPNFKCTAPCTYVDVSQSGSYSTTAQSGTIANSWQKVIPSATDSVARAAAAAAQTTANAALPSAGGTMTGPFVISGLSGTSPVCPNGSGNALTQTGCNGGTTWPGAAGIAVYAGGSAWGTSLAAPSGTVVGTSDTQTLTNKSIAGSEINSGIVAATYLPSFGSAAAGIVPLSGGGTANFLRADGTWSAPPGALTFPVGVLYGSGSTTAPSVATAAQIGATFGCSGGATFLTGAGGCSSSTVATQWGWNAITDAGMGTGLTDNSVPLSTFLNSSKATTLPLMVPCGTYNFTNGVTVNATSSTQGLISILGANKSAWNLPGCVLFQFNDASVDDLWFDNITSAAANGKGLRLEHLTLADTTGGIGAHSGLRITQFNNIELEDVSVRNYGGTQDTGTCSVTNGSTSVTGSGTNWTSAMAGGDLWVTGTGPTIGGTVTAVFQEVFSVSSNTAATLVIPWQGPSKTSVSCSLDYNGIGILVDGGSGFSQYGTFLNVGGATNRVFMDFAGSQTSTIGTSRFKVIGGYDDPSRVVNSVHIKVGQYTDTVDIEDEANNYVVGLSIEGGHANYLGPAEFENTGTAAVSNMCNSGTASPNCTFGALLRSGSTGQGHDVVMDDSYMLRNGAAIAYIGNPINMGQNKITNMRFEDTNGGLGNVVNYSFGDGANCQTETVAQISSDDCDTIQQPLAIQAPQTAVSGTTSGSAVWSEPFDGNPFKKVLLYLNGYENTTATAQTITITTGFTTVSYVTTDGGTCTGVSIAGATVTLPSSMGATQTGLCELKGY